MHLALLTPHPAPPGGGASFNEGLVPALRALGHRMALLAPGDAVPDGAIPLVDGLALGALAGRGDELVARDAVALVHHAAGRLAREQGRAEGWRLLPRLRRVVATSAPVAELLVREFGIEAPAVIAPGAPELPRSAGSGGPGCHILSAGVLTPRKGHDRLLEALARLFDLDWTLTLAGDAQRDPGHAAGLPGLADALRVRPRLTVLADPDAAALEREWARTDLFASASSWEGYPSGVAEALRRGVPAVAWEVGGVAGMLPPSAGMTCAPDDPATFSKCLRRAVFDRELRAAMAEGAWRAGQALPGWPEQARAFQAVLEG